jgi:hypothetical protein
MTVETNMFAQARRCQSLRMGPEAKSLDAWVRLSLGERFDTTLVEALPDDLARLVARFDS